MAGRSFLGEGPGWCVDWRKGVSVGSVLSELERWKELRRSVPSDVLIGEKELPRRSGRSRVLWRGSFHWECPEWCCTVSRTSVGRVQVYSQYVGRTCSREREAFESCDCRKEPSRWNIESWRIVAWLRVVYDCSWLIERACIVIERTWVWDDVEMEGRGESKMGKGFEASVARSISQVEGIEWIRSLPCSRVDVTWRRRGRGRSEESLIRSAHSHLDVFHYKLAYKGSHRKLVIVRQFWEISEEGKKWDDYNLQIFEKVSYLPTPFSIPLICYIPTSASKRWRDRGNSFWSVEGSKERRGILRVVLKVVVWRP